MEKLADKWFETFVYLKLYHLSYLNKHSEKLETLCAKTVYSMNGENWLKYEREQCDFAISTSAEEPKNSGSVCVALTATDIPGAVLSEPLQSHTVPALQL